MKRKHSKRNAVPALLQSPEKLNRDNWHDEPVIVLDIETAPALVYSFSLFKTTIGLDQVVKPTSILSVSWKVYGKGNPVYFWSTQDKEDPYDDKELCEALWGVINKARAVVGHNSSSFDLPLILSRFWHHGLPPVRRPQNLDTMVMAKQVGRNFSNKLAYLSQGLDIEKSDHAKFPGFKLWKGVLEHDPEAWAEMKAYNDTDILATEALFDKLLPYAKTSFQFKDPKKSDRALCPRCGRGRLEKRGFLHTASGRYQRYKCHDCGGWSQSRFTDRPSAVSKNILKAV